MTENKVEEDEDKYFVDGPTFSMSLIDTIIRQMDDQKKSYENQIEEQNKIIENLSKLSDSLTKHISVLLDEIKKEIKKMS
jgi:hypothetical protein